ncbi:MAG: PAP fibrillin [Oscillatoriales cyanobacterium C42_A2020_001]|nr:PAP fibrillin [Leptolyngbyaceae cyanobacterium C42_A2020_001]
MCSDVARTQLKNELFQRLEPLGLQQALFPSADRLSEHTAIAQLIQQLEALNPISHPLHTQHLPTLLGNWQLVYASRGTVVTRGLASFSKSLWNGLTIQQIWQTLTNGSDRTLAAENGAVLTVPWLGTWKLQANGVWRWETDEQLATVTFGAFTMQAMNLWEHPSWNLPALTVPVLEAFRNEALWTTSYLDADLRMGKGATGNLFVFRRT